VSRQIVLDLFRRPRDSVFLAPVHGNCKQAADELVHADALGLRGIEQVLVHADRHPHQHAPALVLVRA
jgi:hypothetical protein